MEEYWNRIVKSLTIEDVGILGILSDEDCTTKLKSLPNDLLWEKSKLTEAIYRKAIIRLTSLEFIDINSSGKKYSYSINEYGLQALTLIIKMNGREEK